MTAKVSFQILKGPHYERSIELDFSVITTTALNMSSSSQNPAKNGVRVNLDIAGWLAFDCTIQSSAGTDFCN